MASPGQEREAAELAAPLVAPEGLTPWMGWRLRVLMGFALAACVAVFGLMRWLADAPQLPLVLADPGGAAGPALALKTGSGLAPVEALAAPDGTSLMPPPGAAVVPRWQLDDAARRAQLAWQQRLHAADTAPLVVRVDGGSAMPLAAQAQGFRGLGVWFWPLVALALLLVLLGAVVVLAQPHIGNALFAAVAWTQAASLALQAALSLPGLLVPPRLLAVDLPLRGALDLVACAAVVQALAMYPRRLPAWRAVSLLAWAVALGAALVGPWLPGAWWWLQGALLSLAALALWVVFHARGRGTGAVQRLTQGLVLAAALGLAGITALAVAAGSGPTPETALQAALASAVPLWQILVAALLLTPLVMRSRQVMREFALLASISVLAASLDLLFVAVFSLSAFSSLAVVVFVSLGLYAGLRQWLFDRLSGTAMLTTERAFGQLYRAARVVQGEPDRLVEQLAQVLRDLFEPLELLQSTRPVPASRVAGGGGSLLVPVPTLVEAIAAAQSLGSVPHTTPGPKRRVATLVLRHARRGQRIFRREDARLADRVVEQLQRAVAYDLAVERGRGEERSRIAQDLHDDIGARLLTLMYRAPDRGTEDYVRDTLKDLKTLTRGLAAGEQPLSLAIAEWRSDVEQRCTAARVTLEWRESVDADLRLPIVAWSGLTRVLRELVSNTLHHGHARHVRVEVALRAGEFALRVSDDGDGRNPEAWSPGLGVGGVRKRVKLLGGSVEWRELQPRGIGCEVRVPHLARPQAWESA